MHPHYPYFPPMHGYYYFRPYNYRHIAQQQMTATGWGANPANPYSNELFRRIYSEYSAGQGSGAGAEPATLPAPAPPTPAATR